jgi:glyoxylase-like metal-dependent hydrolase (beta-lactamase superfamily II)
MRPGDAFGSSDLQTAAWSARLMPPVERVLPGVWSIPIPLPGLVMSYGLVYALDSGSGVTLVDSGWTADVCWTALVNGLWALGASPSDVVKVVVTHSHPDHTGLASRLREVSGAAVLAHEGGHPAETVGSAPLLSFCGVPEEEANEIERGSRSVGRQISTFRPDTFVDDGDVIDVGPDRLTVMWTPGHSRDHICLYDSARGLYFSGDHILPHVSPNVSAHDQETPGPLPDYLASLRRSRELSVDVVLPGHEYRFRDLAGRVDHLLAHHRDRMDEILRALGQSTRSTCWVIASQLRWSRPWSQMPPWARGSATRETLAHLLLLESNERVQRDGGPGPIAWSATSP